MVSGIIIHFALIKKSYIVAGPTASGKSDFAHNLAQSLGGTIINADSVQIYKGIEILSANPFANREYRIQSPEIDGVPYKLFSIRDLSEQITVTEYLELAREEYERAEIPIFVGGTGYYIGAILNGMSPIPEVSAENREKARRMVSEAPAAARTLTDFEFQDPQRMARALEVFLETGRSISEWQLLPRKGAIIPNPTKILIMPHKEILAPRIRTRIEQMIANGAIEEARKNIDYTDRAIGIEELARFIKGEISMEDALENLAVRTDQYAKRQRTWFKNQYNPNIEILHIPTDKDMENIVTNYV